MFYIDDTRLLWYNTCTVEKVSLFQSHRHTFVLKEVALMAISKAQQRATANYVKKAYDRIEVKVTKGKKELIQAHADKLDGGSLNAFINRAITETMERDTASRGE